MKDRIWITWESQRRNRTLSAALGAELHELAYPPPRLRRWFKSALTTLRILQRRRPRLLFAQNPSLVLALIAVYYGRLGSRRTIIDAHNAGIFPFLEREGWKNRQLRRLMQALTRHVIRQASFTIVSNQALADQVHDWGGRAVVLPDPLPDFSAVRNPEAIRASSVLFICTWAADEPYLEVLEAAARLPPYVRVYVTGNSKGREKALGRPLPENVTLTGFVSEQRFEELLASSAVVMDLTTLENCLVCGAYEGVAMERPLVLSNTRALRSYFYKGVVFADNNRESIAAALMTALAQQSRLRAEIRELRKELTESWERRKDDFERLLGASAAGGAIEQSTAR